MAEQRQGQVLTQRPITTTAENDDIMHIVDVSDTTDSPQGTSKQITKGNFAGNITGLIDVLSTCTVPELTFDTDIWALLDTTSGPYTNTANRTAVENSLDAWYTSYQQANPNFEGNLYIGYTVNEDYVIWLTELKAGTLSVSWATGFDPGIVVPSNNALLICFINESNTDYHNSVSPAVAQTPTSKFQSDYAAFINTYNTMEYFAGILYPVAALNPNITEANFLINTYATLKNDANLTQSEFATLADTNYSNIPNSYGTFGANPYYPNYVLSPYNWNGILNKHTDGASTGNITFTTQEFEDDINSLLVGGGAETDVVSVIESYENNILTLRGLKSSTIDLTADEDGCVNVELGDRYSKSIALGTNVNFLEAKVFTKTLTENTVLTFSNYKIGDVKDLIITGDFTLTLPGSVKIITGNYNGLVSNFIQIVCTDSTTPEFWVSISQEQ